MKGEKGKEYQEERVVCCFICDLSRYPTTCSPPVDFCPVVGSSEASFRAVLSLRPRQHTNVWNKVATAPNKPENVVNRRGHPSGVPESMSADTVRINKQKTSAVQSAPLACSTLTEPDSSDITSAHVQTRRDARGQNSNE